MGIKLQGRKRILKLLEGQVEWPPVVVPFGLDPFGWHGLRRSYQRLCDFALKHCTVLPKVYPLPTPLCAGGGPIKEDSRTIRQSDGTTLRFHKLSRGKNSLTMEEIKTTEDVSWKVRKRWIANDRDLESYVNLEKHLIPAGPDLEPMRKKEQLLGDHGLPYAEVQDPFSIVCGMFATDDFYVRLITDNQIIIRMLEQTQKRIMVDIERLCTEASCPFILRLIGAELSIPPFMSRSDFLHYSGAFYRQVAAIADKQGVPAAFHCHGPVREILADIWDMGYSFIEPFEPPPRGNVTIAEALSSTIGGGIVFGGIDDVVLYSGELKNVRGAVAHCLEAAKESGKSYILSQSATPFYDPLPKKAEANLHLFMEMGIEGVRSGFPQGNHRS